MIYLYFYLLIGLILGLIACKWYIDSLPKATEQYPHLNPIIILWVALIFTVLFWPIFVCVLVFNYLQYFYLIVKAIIKFMGKLIKGFFNA